MIVFDSVTINVDADADVDGPLFVDRWQPVNGFGAGEGWDGLGGGYGGSSAVHVDDNGEATGDGETFTTPAAFRVVRP